MPASLRRDLPSHTPLVRAWQFACWASLSGGTPPISPIRPDRSCRGGPQIA